MKIFSNLYKAMEFVGKEYRTRTSMMANIAFSTANLIMPWIGYAFGHWVWYATYQMAITIPVLLLWKYVWNK